MPLAKQEQLIAELIAKSKKREQMSEAERQAEDAQMQQLYLKFNQMMQTMDP